MNNVTLSNREPKCRVFLLGTFRLVVAGEEVRTEKCKSKKALTLLKFLLANQGGSVPRDVLLELLWPDQPGKKTMRTLNTTVYYLRQALQPYSGDEELIRHRNGRYWFHSEQGCWYDVEEFDSLFRQATACPHHERARSLRLFRQAINLYRGDYFAEEEYADWPIQMRERYRDTYIQALLKATSLLAESGDLEEALRLCTMVLNVDPLCSDAYEYKIHLLLAAGKKSEALKRYNEYSRVMHEELGIAASLDFNQTLRALGMPQSSNSGLLIQTHPSGLKMCNRPLFETIVAAKSEYQRLVGEHSTILQLFFSSSLKAAMKDELLDILGANLRSDDIVCSPNDRLVLILLSHIDEKTAGIVKERLVSAIRSSQLPLQLLSVKSPNCYRSVESAN